MATVLIVDDNRELAENLAEVLADGGFASRVYDDPALAASEFRAGVFQAALLDLRMPGMSGAELARHLRAVDPALPAVAMTAWAAQEAEELARRHGVHTVVHKPIGPRALIDLVRTLVDGPQCLIVDDDPPLVHNLVDALLENGIAARAAGSCAEARALWADRRAAVLVVDVRLPDGDGAALMDDLGPDAGTRCILISGVAPEHPSWTRAGLRFLAKPLHLPTLLRELLAS